MDKPFVNKVAESGIITIDLENYFPKAPVVLFDLKDYLFMGLILKEKEFRQNLQQLNKESYTSAIVAVTCSADAIIPMWAYMLVVSALQPVAQEIILGNTQTATTKILIENIQKIDPLEFADKRVVIKGCGDTPIPEEAYLEITKKLRPVVKSVMYGEPCSTVPVFKKEKTTP